jgi:anti-sigma factor RsiW
MFICKDVVENIIDYIDAELDGKSLVELENHLHDCPECDAFARTYRMMLVLAGKLREKRLVTILFRKRLKTLLISRLSSNS